MLKKAFIVPLFLIGIVTGCKKDSSTSNNNGVPNVAVSFTIDLDSPLYVNLTIIGGWMYITGGYLNHGIIVYRASQDQFYAMDRTCTYNNNGSVQVERNGIFAIDSSCGSVFTVSLGGSVNKGPATLGLKNYSANFDGVEYVTVTN